MRDIMVINGVVHHPGVEAAEADVGAAERRHAPGVAPAVGVEHGERPEIDGLLWKGPINQGIESDDVDGSMAMNYALGRRSSAGGVVERHGVPLVGRNHPSEIGIPPSQHLFVRIVEIIER